MQVEHGFEIDAFSVTNAGILFASKRTMNTWKVNYRNAQMKGGNDF